MKISLITLSLLFFGFNSSASQGEKVSEHLIVEGNWCDGSYMLVADMSKKTTSWQWSKDGVVIEDAIENSVNLSRYGNGKYTVVCKSANNKTVYSDTYEFKTVPGVKANFEYSFFYAASAIKFKNTSLETDADCTYSWNFGNGETATELNPIIEFKEGTYTVVLTVSDKNGCKNLFEQTITFAYPH